MKRVLLLGIVALLLLAVAPVALAQGGPRSYLIVANGNSLPNNIQALVNAAGGTITNTIPQIGVAVAVSSNPNFSSQVRGVRAVIPNITVDFGGPENRVALTDDVGSPPNSGADDPRFDLQWGADAVNAPEAWAAGVRGAGVRVAVLDGGFSVTHPDLAANINLALSADFTGEGLAYGPNSDDPTGIFSHGMHVAGTIGAVDNTIGVIGIAPEVELVLVKVLFNYGSGTFEDVAEGILYAASIDADVINMSLGAVLPKSGIPGEITASEVSELRHLMDRAVTYAYQMGTTVIVSAGNDAIDRDHDGNLVVIPGDSPHAIQISATAPVGWALDPGNVFLDNLASYSNYGRSRIDFGAPGGDFVYPGNENCLVAGLVRPCWVFDMVFSTGAVVGSSAYYYWSAGTSMAAPHAAAIAALIIGENGGSMHPAQVAAEMARRAESVDGNGNSPYYGAGRVSSGY